MKRKKHKRKTNQVFIVTSDAADASVKQYRVRSWLLQIVVIIICAFIGTSVGCIYHVTKIRESAAQKNAQQQEAMVELEEQKKQLEEQKNELEAEIESLNNKVVILSETVNEKVQTEQQLSEQLEKQRIPTEFPLTGSASVEEVTEGDAICIFTASVGTMVVATASGTVLAVNDDGEYGRNVWIDHGNGYITIYRNQGDNVVNVGDMVVQGTTLFMIGEENTRLGYQMIKDDVYINPMDMLAISG